MEAGRDSLGLRLLGAERVEEVTVLLRRRQISRRPPDVSTATGRLE
jgi:hypothetical protein